MTDHRCYWIAHDQPRMLINRHTDGCEGDDCRGCQPCPEPLCLVCQREHVTGQACPYCVTRTRDDLADIRTMCDALPDEAEHRGVDSEAAMLAGPAANPEAWRYRATSAMFGRLPGDYLTDCNDELHPLWILAWIEQEWREALDQPTDLTVTIDRAADYINRTLHRVAALTVMPDGGQPPEFADAAQRLHDCRTHLKGVLHDQDQGDRANIACFRCGASLERKLTGDGFEDRWTCGGCRQTYTQAEYNLALRAAIEETA